MSLTQASSTPDTGVTQKTIVVVVGLPYAGKTEVCNQAQLLGYPTVDVSEDDSHRQLKQTFHSDVIAVVEGVWTWEQVADLKQRFNANVPIVHVESDFSTRRERANNRFDNIIIGDELVESLDERMMSRGLESVVRKAQINIHNGKHTSLEELYDRTKAALNAVE